MRYTADSTETDFREQIKILLQRLEIVYQKSEQKTIEFDANGRNYERISKTILNTVVSCWIADRSKNHILATTIMKNRKENIVKEFTIAYGKPMIYVEKGSCYCPSKISKLIINEDPHCLPNYVYDCKRTKAKKKALD